jgi:Fe-S-cluster containining protein
VPHAASRTLLTVHAGYRCHDSGACCSAGWAIPVEVSIHRTLDAALASGRLRTARSPSTAPFVDADLPAELARLLATDAGGACVFHDPELRHCAIHAALGAEAKPLSCRAFPRIIVDDPRGRAVSLSHYCPSALDLLFEPGPIALAHHAPEADDDSVEGLDARDALPPALRDDALIDWESLTMWDRVVAGAFDAAATPEAALDWLWRGYDLLRRWRLDDGPLVDHLARVATRLRLASSDDEGVSIPRVGADRLVVAVHGAIPASLRPALPGPPAAVELSATIDYAWRRSSQPLRRYLAARAHACWPLYQGDGLRTQLRYLDATLALTRAHALAHAPQTGQPADIAIVRDAIRRADLWLVHLASPQDLARALDRF